jgi:hypothetical protein
VSSTLDPVGPLTPEAEAFLRADVAALEERGRHYAGRYDILSLLATLDAERAATPAPLDVRRVIDVDAWMPQHAHFCAIRPEEDECICGVGDEYLRMLTVATHVETDR